LFCPAAAAADDDDGDDDVDDDVVSDVSATERLKRLRGYSSQALLTT